MVLSQCVLLIRLRIKQIRRRLWNIIIVNGVEWYIRVFDLLWIRVVLVVPVRNTHCMREVKNLSIHVSIVGQRRHHFEVLWMRPVQKVQQNTITLHCRKMTWICERCKCKKETGYSIQIKAKTESVLLEHSVPPESCLCFDCALYLLWSRVFPNGIRRFWDYYYISGRIYSLGQKSRYGSVCRIFDINHGFLNPETNLYWDENN